MIWHNSLLKNESDSAFCVSLGTHFLVRVTQKNNRNTFTLIHNHFLTELPWRFFSSKFGEIRSMPLSIKDIANFGLNRKNLILKAWLRFWATVNFDTDRPRRNDVQIDLISVELSKHSLGLHKNSGLRKYIFTMTKFDYHFEIKRINFVGRTRYWVSKLRNNFIKIKFQNDSFMKWRKYVLINVVKFDWFIEFYASIFFITL